MSDIRPTRELDDSGLFSTSGGLRRWWGWGSWDWEGEAQKKPGDRGMVAKGSICLKMLNRGDGNTVTNAVGTEDLHKLAFLAVREDFVELWDQKADTEVLKKVEMRKGRQCEWKNWFKIWQLRREEGWNASLGESGPSKVLSLSHSLLALNIGGDDVFVEEESN